MGLLPTIERGGHAVNRASPSHQPRPLRLARHAENALWMLGPFALLLAIWYSLVAATGVPPRLFPQVTDVARAGIRIIASGQLLRDLAASLERVIIGCTLAVATGVPFGILMGSSSGGCPLLYATVTVFGFARWHCVDPARHALARLWATGLHLYHLEFGVLCHRLQHHARRPKHRR